MPESGRAWADPRPRAALRATGLPEWGVDVCTKNPGKAAVQSAEAVAVAVI